MNSFFSAVSQNSIRRFFFGSFLALAMVAGSGLAYADNSAGNDANKAEVHKGKGKGKGHRGKRNLAQLIKRFDKNNDGKLAVSELPKKMQERIGKADANKDGFLSVEEIKEAAKQRRLARFAKADKNHDGFLTKDEVKAKRWAHIKKADANGDNKVSLDELKARAANKHKNKGKRGQRV